MIKNVKKMLILIKKVIKNKILLMMIYTIHHNHIINKINTTNHYNSNKEYFQIIITISTINQYLLIFHKFNYVIIQQLIQNQKKIKKIK